MSNLNNLNKEKFMLNWNISLVAYKYSNYLLRSVANTDLIRKGKYLASLRTEVYLTHLISLHQKWPRGQRVTFHCAGYIQCKRGNSHCSISAPHLVQVFKIILEKGLDKKNP